MADWLLFLCLFVVSIPGIAVTVPNAIKSMEERIQEAATAEKKIPPMKVIIAIGILQTSILVLIADAAGTVITSLIGFSAPFFEALITRRKHMEFFTTTAYPFFCTGNWWGINTCSFILRHIQTTPR
ncbi:MAG: hypothetical protein HXS54_11870 [Theionarchaea archaeon]|nr:hypothetical protein [Theionarchaea archaeon]